MKRKLTRQQADANGFYWWRYDKDDTPEPVDVRDGMFYSIADRDPTSTTIGEFLGPITSESLVEANRLREALEPLVVRLETMMTDGPECDCPAEGHLCGWTDLQHEMDVARAALGEGKPQE